MAIVEAATPLGISVMVEKPLAITVKQAERMAALAAQYKVHVLTNYETTWYLSNQELYKEVKEASYWRFTQNNRARWPSGTKINWGKC